MNTRNANQAALDTAVRLLGGAIKPTADALRAIGWPRCSKQAIALRRRLGTLPVPEVRYGREYFVTAQAVADALLTPPLDNREVQDATQSVVRRRGRPRNVAPTSTENHTRLAGRYTNRPAAGTERF